VSRNNNQDNALLVILAAVLLLVFVLIPAWYAARAGAVNAPLLGLAKLQLKLFVPFSQEAQTAWEHIAGLDPAALTWERMSAILSYTGKWIRWPLALCLLPLGFAAVFMGRVSNLTRRLNMESLLHNNAESFACLHPIVGRGKYLLSPESHDAGPWRIAESPLQFAVGHGLLTDDDGAAFSPEQVLRHGLGHAESPAWGRARLDAAKTLDVLREQLGPAFGGFVTLPPLRKAPAAAFLAYAGGDKKEAAALLDALSRSYTEKDGIPACPVLENGSFQKRLESVRQRHCNILSEPLLVRHTFFELPWFMALLTRARKKGVLASSQFLFLRPLDRPLWYALNQCGGRAAWAEGFAPWAHYAAEEKAGQSLPEPKLDQAVAALRNTLDAQGWLTDKPLPATTPEPAAQETAPGKSAPELVFAEAEEQVDTLDDYDANEDLSLRRQTF
jgi:hypothetical protein